MRAPFALIPLVAVTACAATATTDGAGPPAAVETPGQQDHVAFAGFGGSLAAWNRAHQRLSPTAYGPTLANGEPRFQIVPQGRLRTITMNFFPAISQQTAYAVVRRELLPPGSHLAPSQTRGTDQCAQRVYVGHALARSLGASNFGALVELESGRGASRTPYDPRAVDSATLNAGSPHATAPVPCGG